MGEFIPDDFLGAGVSVAATLSESATHSRETCTLGEFAVGRLGAARFVTFGGIDASDGRTIGACEGLEDEVAHFA